MKRSDDVFFFTLIDFLLQIFFFGLLLFVVGQLLQQEDSAKRVKDDQAVEKLLKATGISNITELTDILSKMAPLDQLRGTSDFLAKNGGTKGVESAVAAAKAVGGVEKIGLMKDQVKVLSDRVSELEGGWGKVSCIPNVVVNGKLRPKSIARVIVNDGTIILEDPTPEMTQLLGSLGIEYNAVRELGLSAFRKPLLLWWPGSLSAGTF